MFGLSMPRSDMRLTIIARGCQSRQYMLLSSAHYSDQAEIVCPGSEGAPAVLPSMDAAQHLYQKSLYIHGEG